VFDLHDTFQERNPGIKRDLPVQRAFYTKKFNTVRKSDPYKNMKLLQLYCCQKESTQVIIKDIDPNNHDENDNMAQQF
jgi:hypothetical protein